MENASSGRSRPTRSSQARSGPGASAQYAPREHEQHQWADGTAATATTAVAAGRWIISAAPIATAIAAIIRWRRRRRHGRDRGAAGIDDHAVDDAILIAGAAVDEAQHEVTF